MTNTEPTVTEKLDALTAKLADIEKAIWRISTRVVTSGTFVNDALASLTTAVTTAVQDIASQLEATPPVPSISVRRVGDRPVVDPKAFPVQAGSLALWTSVVEVPAGVIPVVVPENSITVPAGSLDANAWVVPVVF